MTRTLRNRIFIIASFCAMILFTPRLCAQTDAEAAKTRQTFADYGKKYIGCPYVSGATGPASFDCSGFVYTVARESIGWQLPRQVKNIYKYCTIIEDSQREIGDLVFFKTTSSAEASHVGIYIGNNQFLNCASDGPNTGVILSSLKESYWKSKYYKTGRFLPASKAGKAADATSTSAGTTSSGSASGSTSGSTAAKTSAWSQTGGSNFMSSLVVDGMFNCDWNFFTYDEFRLIFRGLSGSIFVTYNGNNFKPGVGSIVRWDTETGVLQFPVVFSLTMNEYFRIFAGPVFTLGTGNLPGNHSEEIKASVFPGILGACWNSPAFKVGKSDVSFAQDIHYSVWNKTDGSALSPLKSLASGLVFSTGVRVTLPLSSLIK